MKCLTLIVGISLAASVAMPADGKTRAELLQELIRRAEDDAQKSRAALEAATALEARIKADLADSIAADESARDAHNRQPYSVGGKNFIVGAVGRSFAEAVLAKAESLRKEIAV